MEDAGGVGLNRITQADRIYGLILYKSSCSLATPTKSCQSWPVEVTSTSNTIVHWGIVPNPTPEIVRRRAVKRQASSDRAEGFHSTSLGEVAC